MPDLAKQALAMEARLDWRGAAIRWKDARHRGVPGAAEGLERCRRAEAVIEELCAIAKQDIEEGALREATEPLEAAMEVGGADHPYIQPLKKQWFQLRRSLMQGNKRVGRVVSVVCVCVAFGTIFLLEHLDLPKPVPVFGGGAAAALLFMALYAFVPALRQRTKVHMIRLRTPGKKQRKAPAKKKPEKKMRLYVSKKPKAPRPSRSRALDEWRRNAAREQNDWWNQS